MNNINPTFDEVLAALTERAKDASYFGTFTIALQGGKVAQVREDRVLAIRKIKRNEDISTNGSGYNR